MENIYVIRTIDFIKKHLYKINWRKLSSNPNAISILENTGNLRFPRNWRISIILPKTYYVFLLY